ncbi:membrane metallo-endopeptidase-like 1 [Fopius arisanus]|uniref:Membrane metallo-endopeptidase-like 1 n=1 Tax=Fopius arisanus TaxID=64838 RepID=A0A9R1TRZ1_9HYME|nr:PREDICTED: membrane metallo-endopeptidase-like 1 [Fopius arisanus]
MMSSLTKFLIIFAVFADSKELDTDENLPEDVSIPFFNFTQSPENKIEKCVMNDCVNTAKKYSELVDEAFEPCENFYEFSCGRGIFTRFSQSENAGDGCDVVRDMLESPVEDTDIYPIQKAKKLYQSCVSSDLSPMAFMMESLIEENGGWPMLLDFEAWKEDEHSWQEIDLNVARSTGEYAFFGIDFIPIPGGDPEDQNIYLNTPEEETLPLEENEEEYYSGVKRLLTSFFGERKINVSVEQLRKDIHNLYIFEKALQEVLKIEQYL